LVVAGITPSCAWAGVYGDTLLAMIAARHKGISSLRIEAAQSGGVTVAVSWGAPTGRGATSPLRDAMGRTIGTVTMTANRHVRPAVVAAEIGRRIYVVDNLVEPDPFVAGATRSLRAQAIVENMLADFPDLVTLALHVALPGRDNAIIASNFGRIGKPADADDADVVTRGTIHREVTNGGRRLAVELPLLDAQGRTIGALSASFVIPSNGGEDSAYRRAITVRNGIARRIRSIDTL
jgi:hypothetical protein